MLIGIIQIRYQRNPYDLSSRVDQMADDVQFLLHAFTRFEERLVKMEDTFYDAVKTNFVNSNVNKNQKSDFVSVNSHIENLSNELRGSMDKIQYKVHSLEHQITRIEADNIHQGHN